MGVRTSVVSPAGIRADSAAVGTGLDPSVHCRSRAEGARLGLSLPGLGLDPLAGVVVGRVLTVVAVGIVDIVLG